LVAVQAPADLVVGRDLADALEDLGVGEVAEDVAGEAEAVVQAAPEALAGPHRPAGQGHGLDAAAAEAIDLGLDLEVLDAGDAVLETIGHRQVPPFVIRGRISDSRRGQRQCERTRNGKPHSIRAAGDDTPSSVRGERGLPFRVRSRWRWTPPLFTPP